MLLNSDLPTIYAVAGAPASGKTSFVSRATQNGVLPANVFVHDCDAVMESLSEYKNLLATHGSVHAFTACELPARELAEQQLKQQINSKASVIYDRSCALPSSYDFLHNLVTIQSYKLIMYVLYAPLHLSISRANARQIVTGRYIPQQVITERLQMLSNLWPAYLRLSTEMYLLNSSDLNHTPIAIYKNADLKIYQPALYEFFTNSSA